MSASRCQESDNTCAYAASALGRTDIAAAEAHVATCADCQHELEGLRLVLDRLACWPTDVLCSAAPLAARLGARIAEETGTEPISPTVQESREPEWEQVARGIECKLLATDVERQRVSMLVRLAAGAFYPSHIHAGTEELYLLAGELWIDGRKLEPGDYNCAAPGTQDNRVWTETGCTCVLITSTEDILR